MSFNISGRLHRKYPTESKSNSFQTREFVIQTQEQYPQFIKFQLTQERCNAIDSYEEGDVITVHFDLRGREWQDKYFTNLNAWRIEKMTGEQPATEKIKSDEPPAFQQADNFDDLPF